MPDSELLSCRTTIHIGTGEEKVGLDMSNMVEVDETIIMKDAGTLEHCDI